MTTKLVTIDLPLADYVHVEILLNSLASRAESEAGTLDKLGLPLCAENARKDAANARRLSKVLGAASATLRAAA